MAIEIDEVTERKAFEQVLSGATEMPIEVVRQHHNNRGGYQSEIIEGLWQGWRWRAALESALEKCVSRRAFEWISQDIQKPTLGEDVLVTILIDGIDEAWHAGFWNGVHWFVLDTEHDEAIEVNAGCNFVVTHWARVVTAGGRGE